ncbi:MAG: non-canonical purine NTP pyrophosphatase [Thermoguttaceae bacterium]
MKTIVLGTGNVKKRGEMQELLAPLGFHVLSLADFEQKHDVVEDGSTFYENALKKASEQAKFLGHWVIGEDSGLSVLALSGQPGVFSARFSGEGATDLKNNAFLLEQLGETPLEKRGAFYTCSMVLCDPTGQEQARSEAYCRGRIRLTPFGSNGFGYDPLFEVVEYKKTFGEMNPAIKRWISHRSRAMRGLLELLKRKTIF